MKKILFILILIAFLKTNAQQVEVGFTTGTGAIYMIENRDKNIDLNYAAPIIVAADIKFTPEDAYFGIKLKAFYKFSHKMIFLLKNQKKKCQQTKIY